eukprot:SAG31_NODE_4437_length_3229_cov_11.056531_1_plen_82_part_00
MAVVQSRLPARAPDPPPPLIIAGRLRNPLSVSMDHNEGCAGDLAPAEQPALAGPTATAHRRRRARIIIIIDGGRRRGIDPE